MLDENQGSYFVLLVEGTEVARAGSKTAVEIARSQLPTDKRKIAEVKHVVDDNGTEVLLG